MKTLNRILNPAESIIAVTKKLEEKKKFAYVNISRSAINAVTNNAEKKPPKSILRAVSNCIAINDRDFLKAVPDEFSLDIQSGRFDSIGLTQDGTYYDAAMFEYYFSNKKEVIDIFINRYIKESSNVILTFHDEKTVKKMFGQNQHVITVPYNNYYDKLDSIALQVSEFNDSVDSCILDCPMLATAIAPKIWSDTNMSIIDFGRVVSSAKFIANQERPKSFREDSKKGYKKPYEKR